jgi:hypothetical protein
MEEFSALAARVAAGVGELRGVLILSRDGLVLGAFPEGNDALVKPAWLRFAGLGEPDKGFIEFADELWAYVRRGPYASFAVTGAHVRPGLVMDQLEQMLLAAEELRAKRDAVRLPDAAPAPSGKPRTSLHPEARPAPAPAATPAAEPPARAASPPAEGPTRPPAERAARPPAPQGPQGPVRPSPPQAPPAPARPGLPVGAVFGGQPQGPQPPVPRVTPVPDVSGPPSAPAPAPGPDGGPERPAADATHAVLEPQNETITSPTPAAAPSPAADAPPAGGHAAVSAAGGDEEDQVDPVLLAQEFSRLLQETGGADET